MINQEIYHLYACLPFVELAHEASIKMGPFLFWPASKSAEFLEESHQPLFEEYIQSIGQVKARSEDEPSHFVNTIKLVPAGTTCISIHSAVPSKQREAALVDALYLLYFACTFRNLYYDDEVPSFDMFRKMIPASISFIQHKQNWETLHIEEAHREETICMHLMDQDICQALGQTLFTIYTTPQPSAQSVNRHTRLVRSIHYFIDRFFQRFINLFEDGLHFPDTLFEPEDLIFLASSFETLFDINDKFPKADFKHKMRPLLHLKFSSALELFWKWADDFYEARRLIVQGGPLPDLLFKSNPNFEVSHIRIGIKLFIYSVYYALFKYQLLPSKPENRFTPPDFKWIHPHEVLLFFWTETKLLQKIALFLRQLSPDNLNEALKTDIHFLTTLFSSMQQRFYDKPLPNGITFTPFPKEALKKDGISILNWVNDYPDLSLDSTLLDPPFAFYLQRRLTG